MKPEPIPVRIQTSAEQAATLEHMGDAVGSRLVKLHRCRQLRQAGFSSTLLTNELEDVDGAIQHLHLVGRLLRAFYRTLHHAKLTIAKIADVGLPRISHDGWRIYCLRTGTRRMHSSLLDRGE